MRNSARTFQRPLAPKRWVRVLWLGLLACAGPARGASAEGSAVEKMLGRVPGEAAVTIAVEDLRGHWSRWKESGLLDRLKQAPPVERWLSSDDFRRLENSARDIEAMFQLSPSGIRDLVFGDAVVLSLHLSPGLPSGRAGGLLMVQPSDRPALDRMIDVINGMERASGALDDLEDRGGGTKRYTARVFRDPGRPADYYATLEDGSFAWTNDEKLLQTVLARAQGQGPPGLVDHRCFREVTDALPKRAVVRLFADPTILAREASNAAGTPSLEDLPEPLYRYARAVDFAAVALEADGDLTLHEVDSLDVSRLPEGWRSKPGAGGSADPLIARTPAASLAMATAPVDYTLLYDLLLRSNQEMDAAARERVDTLLRGLLMDRDPRVSVLSLLGPGTLAYLSPNEGELPDAVMAVALNGDEGLARALENAIRTVLTLYALDAAKRKEDWRLVSHEAGGRRVTSMVREGQPGSGTMAFSVGPDALVVGMSPEAVSRFLEASPADADAATGFRAARTKHFPDSRTFFYADLQAAARTLASHRERLAAQIAERRGDSDRPSAAADLAQVEALLRLGHYLYFASDAVGERLIHRRLGLVLDAPEGR